MINKRIVIGISALCMITGTSAVYGMFKNRHDSSSPLAPTGQLLPLVQAVAPSAPLGAPPVTEVTYRLIPTNTAQELNGAVPLVSVGPPARSFSITGGTQTWVRASHCLAQAIYYEAGGESNDGQRAVAQVVLNRVRSPAFPNTVCGVVFEGAERSTGCQFTFACDGSLRREPNDYEWRRAMSAATSALAGNVYSPVGYATHYHANYVIPYWAASMAKIRQIGAHDFYRWPGSWRASTYFSQHYANSEPVELVPPSSVSAVLAPLATATSLPDQGQPADRKASAHDATSAPAIDQKPHTLIASEHPPELDPKLTRAVVLAADGQQGRLSPALHALSQQR